MKNELFAAHQSKPLFIGKHGFIQAIQIFRNRKFNAFNARFGECEQFFHLFVRNQMADKNHRENPPVTRY